jgi:hypothetical protein
LVRWLRGRKQRFAKAPYPKRVPRVRIPPSPRLVIPSEVEESLIIEEIFSPIMTDKNTKLYRRQIR